MSLERAYLDGQVILPTAFDGGAEISVSLFTEELFIDRSSLINVPAGYPASFCALDVSTLARGSGSVSGIDLLWIAGENDAATKTLVQPCPVVANADYAYFHIDCRVQGDAPSRSWYRVDKLGQISKTLSSSLQPADILIWGDKLIADETKL